MKKALFGLAIALATVLFLGCTPTTYTKEWKMQVEKDCTNLMQEYLKTTVPTAILGNVEMTTGTENGRIANVGTNIAKGTFSANGRTYLIAADREARKVYTDYQFSEFFASLSEQFSSLPEIQAMLGRVIFCEADLTWHFTSTGVENAQSDVYSQISGMVPATWTVDDFISLLKNPQAADSPAFLQGITAVYTNEARVSVSDNDVKTFFAEYKNLPNLTLINIDQANFNMISEFPSFPEGHEMGISEEYDYLIQRRLNQTSAAVPSDEELVLTHTEHEVLSSGEIHLNYISRRLKKNLTKNEVISDTSYTGKMDVDGKKITIAKPEVTSSFLYFTGKLSSQCEVQYVKEDGSTGSFGKYKVKQFPNGFYSPAQDAYQESKGMYLNSFGYIITLE